MSILLTLIVLMNLMCTSFGYQTEGERLAKIRASQNFKDGVFVNEIETKKLIVNGFKIMTRFLFESSGRRQPEKQLPIVRLNRASFSQKIEKGMRLTWMGHSTVLLETGLQNILIDPVFSTRASPVNWAGPKRFHEIPVEIEELPDIDIVLISHDHYDHLDTESIIRLKEKTKSFVMPLGVGAHLEGWGVASSKIYELDWWESVRFKEIKLVCTPARHFSGRALTDENKTLWASWVIESPKRNIFYSGDTGPMPSFKTIGSKYGPFDLTIIQLGAYGKFWPYIHMTPEEGIKAHNEVRGKLMLPVHWGTFDLAFHSWDEPIIRTREASKTADIKFLELKPGEMIEF